LRPIATHDAVGRCIQFIGGSWWSSIVPKGVHAAFGRLVTAIFFYLSAITSDQDAAANRTCLPITRASRTGGGHFSG
jgi:hypothetical protein